MFIRFLRLLFGCVRFEATEGFLDRFINLCWSMEIPLWDVKKTGKGLTATTGKKGYRKLRAAAKQAGVRLHATEKNGFPFLLKKNSMRAGMIAGAALGVIFMLYAFSAVWQVDVEGCETLNASAVLAAAEEEGLTRGVPRRSVDPASVRRALVSRFSQINWCAVNLRGAKAEIRIREVKKGAGVFDESGVYDVIAAKDGQIELIDAYRGKVLVRNLDTVTKGQMLISGVYETRNGTAYSTHAAGKCMALTTECIRAHTDPSSFRRVSGLRRSTSFYVFGARVPPFGAPNRQRITCSEKDLSGSDYTLPLGKRTVTAFDTEPAQITDREKTQLLAMMNAYDRYRERLKQAQLIDSDHKTDRGEIVIVLHLREDIAVERRVDIPDGH
ncbi:MAG: sporulation protein YqfD [Clostridia bacterium]|nr:sporulation protein YqfD [Clostridia bacterium]